MVCFYLKEFTIEDIRGKKCIQYIDQQGSSSRYYALKVIDRTTVIFMVSY